MEETRCPKDQVKHTLSTAASQYINGQQHQHKTSSRHLRAPGRQNRGSTVVWQQLFGARGVKKEGDPEEHTGGWGGGAYAGGECGKEGTLGVEKRSKRECIHRPGGKAG